MWLRRILPLKRRQRDAASPIETKGRNWLGHIQAVEQAFLKRTSLPPSLSAKTLTVPCLLRGRRAEVNNQECFLDAEMTQLPQHSSSWPPTNASERHGRVQGHALSSSKARRQSSERDKHVIYYYKADPGSSRYFWALPGKSSEGVSAPLGSFTVPACIFVEVRVQITIGLSRSAPARWPEGPWWVE